MQVRVAEVLAEVPLKLLPGEEMRTQRVEEVGDAEEPHLQMTLLLTQIRKDAEVMEEEVVVEGAAASEQITKTTAMEQAGQLAMTDLVEVQFLDPLCVKKIQVAEEVEEILGVAVMVTLEVAAAVSLAVKTACAEA